MMNESAQLQPVKQAEARIHQHYSKEYVRLTINIPGLRTNYRWSTMRREAKNGQTIRATYHDTHLYFMFLLHPDRATETRYEYSTREPLKGPVQYCKSYIKYKNNRVIWYIHKAVSW